MSDDDAPLVQRIKTGRRLSSKPACKGSNLRAAHVAAGAFSDSSPLQKKGRVRKLHRDQFMRNQLLEVQCKEGREGDTASDQPNSSDDADKSDLSNVSQGLDHSNGEMHVYQEGMGTQGSDSKFHTPLHNQGASRRGLVSVAGACSAFDIPPCLDLPRLA